MTTINGRYEVGNALTTSATTWVVAVAYVDDGWAIIFPHPTIYLHAAPQVQLPGGSE